MKTPQQYKELQKPTWAPPSWLFGPVWTFLYIIIAISFGYVGYLYATSVISIVVILPFILNLIFNIAYTPIQFGLKNIPLATLDILLVLGTLIWAGIEIFNFAPVVAYVNIPYLIWVSFATVLQVTILFLNRNK